MRIRSVRLILSTSAVTLLLAACADSADDTPTTAPDADDDPTELAFGEPASAEDADRTVEIIATDDPRFDPESVTVTEGETVLFRIVNEGQLVHDFTLGDEAAQQEHEEEMAEMGGMEMHDEPKRLRVGRR